MCMPSWHRLLVVKHTCHLFMSCTSYVPHATLAWPSLLSPINPLILVAPPPTRRPQVRAALSEGFDLVSVDTWLGVIPQIIARIHTANADVRELIHTLLVRIGKHHPQVRGQWGLSTRPNLAALGRACSSCTTT